MELNRRALRKEWAREHRGRAFRILCGLTAFTALLLFLPGTWEMRHYMNIYSLLLFISVPLSQLAGWPRLRREGRDLYYRILPLSSRELSLQCFFSSLGDLLILFSPAVVLGFSSLLFYPDFGSLILSLFLLFLQGTMLTALSHLCAFFSRKTVVVLLLNLLLELPLFLFLPLTPWNIDQGLAGYFRGDSLLFYSLLTAFFLWLQWLFIERSRR